MAQVGSRSAREGRFHRHMVAPLVGLGVAAVAAMLALALWLTHSQDRTELAQEKHLIETALGARIETLKRNLGDYSRWDDTVDNLVLGYHPDWADANLGPYLYGVQGYEYVVVVDGRDRVRYASHRDRRAAVDPVRLLGRNFTATLAALRRTPPDRDVRAAGIASIAGRPVVIGLAPILPSPGSATRLSGPAHYVLFVKVIDRAFLDALGRDYGIPGLRFGATQRASIAARDLSGRTAATLTWDAGRPGTAQVGLAITGIALIALLIALCAIIVLRAGRRAIDDSEAANLQALAEAEQAQAIAAQLAEEQRHARTALEFRVAQVQVAHDRLQEEADASRSRALRSIQDEYGAAFATLMQAMADEAARLADAADALDHAGRLGSASVAAAVQASDESQSHAQDLLPTLDGIGRSVGTLKRQIESAAVATQDARQTSIEVQDDVAHLREAAARITSIATDIGKISRQTNHLALNAGIEAARAGEAGKGFAVVAQEVKELARLTAEMTGEIAETIAATGAAIEGAIKRIGGIAGSFDQISGTMVTVSVGVESHGLATHEASLLAGQLADGSSQAADAVRKVDRLSQATIDAAATVSDAVAALRAQMAQIDRAITDFGKGMRAAA